MCWQRAAAEDEVAESRRSPLRCPFGELQQPTSAREARSLGCPCCRWVVQIDPRVDLISQALRLCGATRRRQRNALTDVAVASARCRPLARSLIRRRVPATGIDGTTRLSLTRGSSLVGERGPCSATRDWSNTPGEVPLSAAGVQHGGGSGPCQVPQYTVLAARVVGAGEIHH